jgi:uncharacterized protein involved in exopolysaccharide biosynthesis
MTNANEDIDLKALLKNFWDQKILIILVTSAFAISSVYYSLTLHNIYTSSVLLEINSSDNGNQVSDLASRYGGLASLAGISMPAAEGDKASYVKETLRSRQFTKHILDFPSIRENLMAAKSFNVVDKNIIYDDSIYNYNSKSWVREVSRGKNIIPSYLEVHKHLKDSLIISQDDESGFISISFKHVSPVFSYEFLNLIVNELNAVILDRDLREAKESLVFLKIRLAETKEKGIRDSINSLIASQLEIIMLASVGEEYIIRSIDKPFIPEEKTSPSRSLICISITILGFILSLVISSIIAFFKNKKTSA